MQFTALGTPIGGPTLEYDTVSIFTLVEEDGELKVLGYKEFSDPEKRGNFHKALFKEGQIA